nr:uncharacterized protein LOC107445139 [Parasteatoda tepidariorum]
MRTVKWFLNSLLAICLICKTVSPLYSQKKLVKERNCSGIRRMKNATSDGTYLVDVDGEGPLHPIWVDCHMGDGVDPYQIVTIVHHNAEKDMDVRGYEEAGKYALNISYMGASEAHVMSLIDSSYSCQQYIKWACKGSMFGFWYPPDLTSWWIGRYWRDQYYWGGAETDSRSCGCHPYCKETKRNSTCNCDDNNKLKWLEDSGLLLDSKRLPVLQLRFGDTGEVNEAGKHRLGPLICRAEKHREILMNVLTAPVNFTSPGYNTEKDKSKYPPAFHRYTWTVKIPKGETMELVFSDYDVVHFGAYNTVPRCKSAVTVMIDAENSRKIVISRQKSPPYYVSEGARTVLNITLTTCNQDSNLKLGKGFKASVRRTECGGCNAGLGVNKGITYCSGVCGIITSKDYPFPPVYYFLSEVFVEYNHTWILRVQQNYIIQLVFQDFDVPSVPGSRNCSTESGVLWLYNGEKATRNNLIGGFCNLNREGIIYSASSTMTIVYVTRWKKIGNGRGFHAMYRGIARRPTDDSRLEDIRNIAKGKPAKQSSTRDERYAFYGVDGNSETLKTLSICTATKFETDPWWQVNLQKRHLIHGIEIHSTRSESKLGESKLMWPEGLYGLPMPVSGCPSSKNFTWKTGYRYHDIQYDIIQDTKVLHWSEGCLLKGGLQKETVEGVQRRSGVVQHFCMKTSHYNSTNSSQEWPAGKYCIFQYGDSCPPKFTNGNITLRDTHNSPSHNKVDGFYPKGNYTSQTTTINFCCRDDDRADNPIILPNDDPFYLFKYGDNCQKVEGMSEMEHYFHFNEDVEPWKKMEKEDGLPKYGGMHPNIDKDTYEKGIAIYYCYYDIYKSLRGFRVVVDDTGLVDTYIKYYDDLSYGIPHTEVGKFLNAYTCAVYPVTNREFHVWKVNCSQPVYGQYVTLQVYSRFDSLRFCEIKVFGVESCGQPLGMASEEIFDSQISASSSHDQDKYHYTNARLNSNFGWCASFKDDYKNLTVDLQKVTTVTGIILQGLNGAPKMTIVKKFFVTFSNDSKNWLYEEEPVGQQKVYICEQCKSDKVYKNDLEIRYNFLKGISTRFIQIRILDFSVQPCLRMEILGCRKEEPCEYSVKATEGTVYSPNYPLYYGQDKSCEWVITPESKKHIEMNFLIYDMADQEDESKAGKCKDELIVYPKKFSNNSISFPQGKHFPKRIISNGTLKIRMKSCFRYSRSRFRGFYAHYKSVDCPGCGIGSVQCSDGHVCESPCGKILSYGYPLNYPNNHRCGWLIRTNSSHFISLTFQDFDIKGGENCQFDYLAVYNGDSNEKSNLIGRFCNTKKPPLEIVSNWNTLTIEFSSDADETGRGFSLTYASMNYEIPTDIANDTKKDEDYCLPGWEYHNGYCYNAYHGSVPIQWYEAERKCQSYDASSHLVSILDEKENAIIHYFLTNVWHAKHKALYIGLNDDAREGVYRWSDGNPMIYADWAMSSRSFTNQPDGGTYQDCTMLRVDSGHSTAHWHDIPCSLGKLTFYEKDGIDFGGFKIGVNASLNSYICKMKSKVPINATRNIPSLFSEINTHEIVPVNMSSQKYFQCQNGEIITILSVCDFVEDCKDGSDEYNCTLESCPRCSFQCDNGNYIIVDGYCDYEDDCGDNSDESRCDYRQCGRYEFQCRNKQCIPFQKRCNLLLDCFDGTDEIDCKGYCNNDATFKCYDGTCIPRHALCDGHRDCPGNYHEDEQIGCTRKEDRMGREEEKNLCSKRDRRTCLDLYMLDNIRTSGYYVIDSDGSDGSVPPFPVYCEIDSDSSEVITVVNHDSEERIYVRSSRESPGSYIRSIVYDNGMDKIRALINASKTCRQNIVWECCGTGFHFGSLKPISWWVSWDKKPQYYWGGAKSNLTCGCYETGCRNPNYTCNCDSVKNFEWSKDEGYLTDKRTLPVLEVRFGHTYKTGQYGFHRIGRLECRGNAVEYNENCTNSTNYMKCLSGVYRNISSRCLYEFDQYNYQLGCRDVTHLKNCENFQCPDEYVKCPNSYCIPTMYICNGIWDCIGGGDEINCGNYVCPGKYKCYNSSACLPLNKLCNGEWNCPIGDDELLCDFICPENCTCIGLFVSCAGSNATLLPSDLSNEIRSLNFSCNQLDLGNTNFSRFWSLGELYLQFNDLSVLPPEAFLGLRNLYKLDLSHNKLTVISNFTFKGLNNVRYLNLENNPTLMYISSDAFHGLKSLLVLNLTDISLKVLKRNTFTGMSNLEKLGLQNNKIEKVEDGAFHGLSSVTVLDITGNDIVDFTSDIFEGLDSLEYLKSDSYTFCCKASPKVPFSNCQPPADVISSCTDLMRTPVQRSFLWVLGVVAFLGNLFVIVWRIKTKDANRISSTLILNLGCADFLMGIYLIIIASVDVHYRGIYIENSDRWKRSGLCNFCGFLSTMSSEVSVQTLSYITLDRLICLCFPLSHKRFSIRFTHRLIALSWISAVLMASIPLVIEPYFKGQFYARSGVCLALHITNHRPAGWEYSVAIFFCTNVLGFLVIVGSYMYMYFTIKKSYKNMGRLMARHPRENKIGRQMALIALTNSMCWCPVIVMGLLAMFGVNIPGEVYAWTAIFVLPLNSATNPLIYTISSLHFHTKLLSKFGLNVNDTKGSYSNNTTVGNSGTGINKRTMMRDDLDAVSFKPPHGYVTLLHYLRTVPGLTPRHLLKIAIAICKTLTELHARSYVLGGIDVNAVFICENSYLVSNYTFSLLINQMDDFWINFLT